MERQGNVIATNASIKNFYYQYVLLVAPMLKLRKQEAEVFSQLLFYNYKYKELEFEVRNKIIFDYDTKTKIRYELVNKYDEPMSVHSFYNILTSLRKKGLIFDNKLNPKYLFIPKDKKYSLTFQWMIDDTEEVKEGTA